MHTHDVVLRPILTEKSDALTDSHNQYVFEVARAANKRQIRSAIEELFGVSVVDVRTAVMPGKVRRWGRGFRRRPAWKKAIVTLTAGERIDLVGS